MKKVALLAIATVIVLLQSIKVEAAEGDYWYYTAKGWMYSANYADQWAQIDGEWYYFNENGIMTETGYIDGYWVDDQGAWNEEYSSGGWRQNAIGWWYEDNGWYPVNEKIQIDGVWYYFDINGYLGGYLAYDDTYVSKDYFDNPADVDPDHVPNTEFNPVCSYPNEDLFRIPEENAEETYIPQTSVNNSVKVKEEMGTAISVEPEVKKITLTEDAAARVLQENATGIGQIDTGMTITYLFYCEEDGSYCYYDAAQGGIIVISSDQLDLTSGSEIVYQSEHLILKMSNNIPTVTKTEEDEGLVD